MPSPRPALPCSHCLFKPKAPTQPRHTQLPDTGEQRCRLGSPGDERSFCFTISYREGVAEPPAQVLTAKTSSLQKERQQRPSGPSSGSP
ncbi:Hypothetical predicted protein [Marmota monax]|uniref:Uncharacterized protein n=1 Tax=Marmota monax TaxID=9995 RepID=A0A5E4BBK7_MARMO|nr:Hypothetical predicted protein [Marmota monax]